MIKGLTNKQVQQRINNNLINNQNTKTNKTYKQIITSNIFTYFNFINTILAILIFACGSIKNLLFMNIVIINSIIGIIQEIRAKKILDQLNILHNNSVNVLRENKIINIKQNEIVMDDILVLKSGNQIVCDSIIVEGNVEVNEALISGESDILLKKENDLLYSGCYIVSGSAYAKVIHINEDNLVEKILKTAKKIKQSNSQLQQSIQKIIKFSSIILLPMSILLFVKHYYFEQISLSQSIIATSAALIGMIPEGLVLLTSIALALGSIQLAKKQTLIQELYGIETLARVNMICFDKTGTITSGNLTLAHVHYYHHNYNYNELMYNILSNQSLNASSLAIFNSLKPTNVRYLVEDITLFSSERKYSSITFKEYGTFYLGALAFIKHQMSDQDKQIYEDYLKQGYRILALVHNQQVLALYLLSDQIKKDAYSTLNYLHSQNISVKFISGDDKLTICNTLNKINYQYHQAIDVSNLSDEQLKQSVFEYDIFARVSPQQKKLIIDTLKQQYVCAMVGDGVNDVMALKSSDCGISLASGCDAAKNSANIVLLNNNFSSIPIIINEGRRVINNIERSASLFLTKTIFSFLLAIITILFIHQYPFVPIQLTLLSTCMIGIPSFLLTFEPSYELIKGHFLHNVFKTAFPCAISIILSIIYLNMIQYLLHIDSNAISTMSVYLSAICMYFSLVKLCIPFTKLRILICISMFILFIVLISVFPTLFSLTSLTLKQFMILIPWIIFILLYYYWLYKK